MFKKIFSVIIIAVVFCLIPFCVFAETYDFKDYKFSAEFNENYTVIEKSNIRYNEETIKKIGHTKDSVSAFMEKNDIVLIAISNGNKSQLQLSCKQTEFSKKANSLSALSEEAVASIGNTMFPYGFSIEKINDVTYICNRNKNVTQYITFENEKLYTITLYDIEETEETELLGGIKIQKKNQGGSITAYVVIISIIIISLIIAAIVGIVIVATRLTREIREKNENDLQAEEIKIKRRKL